MTRSALVRAFSVFYFSRFHSPSFPSNLFSSIHYIPHPVMIHTWPFVLACLLTKMNRERTSKQADAFSSFLFAYRECMRTHALLFFLLLLFDDQCIGDIVFQACSRCRRRFTSISIIHLRTRGKEREC
jgi:L-asparagine transporter-like permease